MDSSSQDHEPAITAKSRGEGGAYRIVEDLGHPTSPTWPWRFDVEQLVPAHRRRFLFWRFDVPDEWVVVLHWKKHEACRAWIEAAKSGEMRRVVG